jgi:hypothetical protein
MGILALVSPIQIVSMTDSSREIVPRVLIASEVFGVPMSAVHSQSALVCPLGISPNCSINVSQRIMKGWKRWKGIYRRPCH